MHALTHTLTYTRAFMYVFFSLIAFKLRGSSNGKASVNGHSKVCSFRQLLNSKRPFKSILIQTFPFLPRYSGGREWHRPLCVHTLNNDSTVTAVVLSALKTTRGERSVPPLSNHKGVWNLDTLQNQQSREGSKTDPPLKSSRGESDREGVLEYSTPLKTTRGERFVPPFSNHKGVMIRCFRYASIMLLLCFYYASAMLLLSSTVLLLCFCCALRIGSKKPLLSQITLACMTLVGIYSILSTD